MNIRPNKQPLINSQSIVLITFFAVLIIAAAAWNSGIVNVQDPIGYSMTKSPTWKVPIISTETLTPTLLAETGWWSKFPTPVPAFHTSTPTVTSTSTKTPRPTITPKKNK